MKEAVLANLPILKAALRRAFSDIEFKFSKQADRLRWTGGPTDIQVRAAVDLPAALTLERSLSYEERTLVIKAWARGDTPQQHAEQAVTAAWRARRQRDGAPAPDAFVSNTDSSVHAAFEKLRLHAEAAVGSGVERVRRPTWAPPLLLDGKLLDICRECSLLAPTDDPIARLWAVFADPSPAVRTLREQKGLALLGIKCRGFQLFAGRKRGTAGNLLFEAQRMESGDWQFGPNPLKRGHHYDSRRDEWERLVVEHARQPDAASAAKIAKLDADYANGLRSYDQREWLYALAKGRVLNFAGAPGAQAEQAGRLCGRCFRCAAKLTDPKSTERGIGPCCYKKTVDLVTRMAASGRKTGWVADWLSLPVAFVGALLGDDRGSRMESCLD